MGHRPKDVENFVPAYALIALALVLLIAGLSALGGWLIRFV
jgi:hypothetical protein